jgi:two-component sensor histidine kinase
MADASLIEPLRGLLALTASPARARDDELSGRGRSRVDGARDARAFAERRQLVLNGPLMLLPPQVAGMLSLALHGLVTNAAKYGALSAIKDQVVQH